MPPRRRRRAPRHGAIPARTRSRISARFWRWLWASWPRKAGRCRPTFRSPRSPWSRSRYDGHPVGSAPLPHGPRNHQRPHPRRLLAPQPARIAPALPSRGRSPSDGHLSPTRRHLPDGYLAFHDRDTGAVDRSGPPAPFSSPLKPRHENPRPKGQMMPVSTRAGVVRLNLGDAAQVGAAYAEILGSAEAYLSALPLDGGGLGGGDRAG